MINTKTKGELGYRIEYDVEHDLFHPQNVYSDEYITPTFVEYVRKLEGENAELEEELVEADNATDCFNRQEEIIEKAKELIKRLLSTPRTIYGRDEDGEVTSFFNSDYEELEKQAEQFLKEIE